MDLRRSLRTLAGPMLGSLAGVLLPPGLVTAQQGPEPSTHMSSTYQFNRAAETPVASPRLYKGRTASVASSPGKQPPQAAPAERAELGFTSEPAPRTESAGAPRAGVGFPSLSRSQDASGAAGTPGPAASASPLVTVASSLAVVLGLFAGLVWLTRKFNHQAASAGNVSKDAVDLLGTYPIDPRNRVCLLRVGVRVVVAAQSSSGMQPLAEITDPEEVRHLVAVCRGDARADFAKTLEAIEREKAAPGFLGDEASEPNAFEAATNRSAGRKLGRLFASSM